MAIPQLPKALITGGNSTGEKAILSVVEAQVRGILTNENTTISLRTSAVAEQIATLNGVGMAIYRRIAERIVWGSDYDPITGSTRQWTTVKTTTVILDQRLTINWAVEDFDMERFLASDPNVRATLMAEWSSSMIKGYLYAMEAIFLTGIKDYCVAKSQVLPINLLYLTPDSALDAYYTIGKANNKIIKAVTLTEVGVNLKDIIAAIGMDSYLEFSRLFQKINLGNIAAETVTTGKLYRDSVFGVNFFSSFYLEQEFVHGTETGLHLQKTFDLTKLLAAFIHRNAVAMPSSFQMIRQVLDNNTGNLKWIGKALFSVPTMIRGRLMYTIMSSMPTAAEIKDAQSREWSLDTDPTGQHSNSTYKLADFDDTKVNLTNVVYFKNLGKITMAGETPTIQELGTAIVNAGNVGIDPSKIMFKSETTPTGTSATITGTADSIYGGEVTVTYNTGSDPTPSENIQKVVLSNSDGSAVKAVGTYNANPTTGNPTIAEVAVSGPVMIDAEESTGVLKTSINNPDGTPITAFGVQPISGTKWTLDNTADINVKINSGNGSADATPLPTKTITTVESEKANKK